MVVRPEALGTAVVQKVFQNSHQNPYLVRLSTAVKVEKCAGWLEDFFVGILSSGRRTKHPAHRTETVSEMIQSLLSLADGVQ